MRRYYPILIVMWTVMIVGAFLFNVHVLRKNLENIVQTDSEAFFKLLFSVHQWNSCHGLVYVPVTESVRPDAYMVHTHRDVVTNFGDTLTLAKTANMVQQLSEFIEKSSITKFHITSLNPIRPSNQADEWETKALQTFKDADDRFCEKIQAGDSIIFRYMAPLVAEQGCLECHASQGNVRGGISINTPYHKNYFAHVGTSFNKLIAIYSFIFLVGFFLLYYFKLLSERHERKVNAKNKELQDLNTSKDKFFSVIAHDLKSPAANIESLSQTLREKFDDLSGEEQKSYLDMLVKSTKTHNELLHTLLDLSRFRLGSKHYNPEQLDIRNLANEVLEQTKLQAIQKQINQINQVEECFAKADKNMITMVVRNIVVNAIKFTHQGGQIVIRAEKNNSEILISIADSGIGIADSKKDRIFDVDYNKSTTGTANEAGTGLGLILCKEYVERNGGKIWFESEMGKGTTFFFTLPTI